MKPLTWSSSAPPLRAEHVNFVDSAIGTGCPAFINYVRMYVHSQIRGILVEGEHYVKFDPPVMLIESEIAKVHKRAFKTPGHSHTAIFEADLKQGTLSTRLESVRDIDGAIVDMVGELDVTAYRTNATLR